MSDLLHVLVLYVSNPDIIHLQGLRGSLLQVPGGPLRPYLGRTALLPHKVSLVEGRDKTLMLLHFRLIDTLIVHNEIAKAPLRIPTVKGCNVLVSFPFMRLELRFYLRGGPFASLLTS